MILRVVRCTSSSRLLGASRVEGLPGHISAHVALCSRLASRPGGGRGAMMRRDWRVSGCSWGSADGLLIGNMSTVKSREPDRNRRSRAARGGGTSEEARRPQTSSGQSQPPRQTRLGRRETRGVAARAGRCGRRVRISVGQAPRASGHCVRGRGP